jgi:hypothetical protein
VCRSLLPLYNAEILVVMEQYAKDFSPLALSFTQHGHPSSVMPPISGNTLGVHTDSTGAGNFG